MLLFCWPYQELIEAPVSSLAWSHFITFLLLKLQMVWPNSCTVFLLQIEAYLLGILYIAVCSSDGLFWFCLLMSIPSAGRILLLAYPEVLLSSFSVWVVAFCQHDYQVSRKLQMPWHTVICCRYSFAFSSFLFVGNSC